MAPPLPHSYSRSRPQVREEILGRIAAGDRLKAICAEAGMPCSSSVNGWARKDPEFAARLKSAYVHGDWRQRLMMDEAKAQGLIARLAAGATLAEALADPETSSRRTHRHWMQAYGWFGEEVRRQHEIKAAEKAHRLRRRRRAYDPEVGNRIYVRLWKGETLRAILRSDKAFPSLAVLERWRREDPEFDRMLAVVLKGWSRKRARERCLCTPQLTEAITDELLVGESLRSLSRRPGMPSYGTLLNWVRTRPDFARQVAWACEHRAFWYEDQMAEVVARGGFSTVREMRRALAPLSKQMTRLRKHPGWKRRARRLPASPS